MNTDELTVEVFEDMDRGKAKTNTRPFQMKKVHVKRNSKQQTIKQFSILHLENITKKVNENKWAGRNFTPLQGRAAGSKEGENCSTPWQ